MVANLTRLFQFVGMFSQLAQFPKDQYELQIRVDYMEPTASHSFTWESYALLPNRSALLLESRDVPCPESSVGCGFMSALIFEDYNSTGAVLRVKGSEGTLRVGPYPPTEQSTQMNEYYGALDMDLKFLVSHRPGYDSAISPLIEISSEIYRNISRRMDTNLGNGFDRCLLGRVSRQEEELNLEGLYELDKNSSQMSPPFPLNFCFRDPNGYLRTQFFSPEMLALLSPEYGKVSKHLLGMGIVRLSLAPIGARWFLRLNREVITSGHSELILLVGLAVVLGVLLVFVDLVIMVLIWAMRANNKLKLQPPSRVPIQHPTDTIAAPELPECKITVANEATSNLEESQLQTTVTSSNRHRFGKTHKSRKPQKPVGTSSAPTSSMEPLMAKPSAPSRDFLLSNPSKGSKEVEATQMSREV